MGLAADHRPTARSSEREDTEKALHDLVGQTPVFYVRTLIIKSPGVISSMKLEKPTECFSDYH